MEKIRIGVELGMTNSFACYKKGRKSYIVRLSGRYMSPSLPSVLYLKEDGSVLVGERARKMGFRDPLNCIHFSKMETGNFDKGWNLRGRIFTPADVAAEILKEIKRRVVRRTEAEEDAQIEAVISVPAYFSSSQIDEMKKAGEQAGLTVLGIVTNPYAASIASMKELGMKKQKIFVMELGRETFDISVLEANAIQHTILVMDGDHKLGGNDFDKFLFEYIRARIEDDLGVDLGDQKTSGLSDTEYYVMLARIQEATCEAREELSGEEEYKIYVDTPYLYKNQGYTLGLTIDRDKFYELCQELFDRIKSRIDNMFCETKDLEIENIDRVVFAGESCYIPGIKEMAEKILKKPVDITMDCSVMVAAGALLYCGYME